MKSAQSYAVYRIGVDPTNPFLARVILASPSMKELLSIPDLDDFVTWFDEDDPRELIRLLEPDVHVNGKEYGRRCIEADVVEQFDLFAVGRLEVDVQIGVIGGHTDVKLDVKIRDRDRIRHR